MDSTENGKNYLESIFKSAEHGMTEFNMPLTNEGKFEVLMYGIWLGMKALDEFGIPQNYKESLSNVNEFLVDYEVIFDGDQRKKSESYAVSLIKQLLNNLEFLLERSGIRFVFFSNRCW